jgi:hypothetical protein
MNLSGGQSQGNGTTISVNEGMDLAREAPREWPMLPSEAPPFYPPHRAGGRGRR